MGVFNSSGTGNWSSTGTWGGTGPPGDGDTVTIGNGHIVTIAASTSVTVGDSANPTTPAIRGASTGGTGVLAIGDGASLTVKGNVQQGNAAWTAGSGVTIEFDNATALIWYVGDTNGLANARLVVTGTSGSHTIIRSKSGGANGRFTGAYTRTGRIDATYVDFLRIGDASNAAFTYYISGSGDTFSLAHCTLDYCGRGYFGTHLASNTNFSLTDCVWTNTVHATESINVSAYTNDIGTGARNVLRCAMDKLLTISGRHFTVQHCLFESGISTTVGANYTWTTFDKNVLIKSGGDTNMPAGMTNCFLLTGGTNPHFFSAPNYAGYTYDGLIFQATGDGLDGDGVIATGGSTGVRHTITRCIVLPNTAGTGSSGTLATTNGLYNYVGPVEHNTCVVSAGIRNAIQVNETTASPAGAVSTLRANIFAALSALQGSGSDASLVVSYPGSVGVDNIIDPASTTNNGLYGLATTSRASGKTNQGTSYDTPTTTTTPGANDVAVNPNFVDITRNFEQYATTKSQSATLANTVAALKADLASEIPALLAWVRAGWRPRASSLNGATYGGDSMTLDAAGNALTGTIGAMAWISSGGVYPFHADSGLSGNLYSMGL